MIHKPHPAAELFPKMSDADLKDLAADILANGQHEPIIILTDGRVLDGRNRLEACKIAKVEPEVQLWDREDDRISPTAWVISKNLKRRHLTGDQAAMVAARALPLFGKEAKERQRLSAKAPVTTRAEVKGSAPVALPSKPAKKAGKAAAVAAEAIGSTTRKVERAKWLEKKDPARAEKVAVGDLSLKKAEKQIKRAEQVAQVKVYRPPSGQYAVIVTDYPWKYSDTLEGSDAIRGGCPYPPMTIEEICALELPVAKDCALFMCVTNSHLIDPAAYAVVARALFDRYQLVPKQIQTWRKVTLDGTRDKFGGGHVWRNNTEHLVRFERGRPVFNSVTQTTCFDAPLGEHSEKPQKMFDLIEALCPGEPKLEMFARAERAGWKTTGAELPKKGLDGKERGGMGRGIEPLGDPVPEVEPEGTKLTWRTDPSDETSTRAVSRGLRYSCFLESGEYFASADRHDDAFGFRERGPFASMVMAQAACARYEVHRGNLLPPGDDGTRCGIVDKRGQPCVLDLDHHLPVAKVQTPIHRTADGREFRTPGPKRHLPIRDEVAP